MSMMMYLNRYLLVSFYACYVYSFYLIKRNNYRKFDWMSKGLRDPSAIVWGHLTPNDFH